MQNSPVCDLSVGVARVWNWMYFFISPKWISVSSVHTRRVHVRTVFTIVACGVSLSNAETGFVVVATAAYRALETKRDYCVVATQGVCKRNPCWPGWRPACGHGQCVYACHRALESSMAQTDASDYRWQCLWSCLHFKAIWYDECRLSAGWPPTLKPSQLTWPVSLPVACYHRHHYRHLLVLLDQKADTHFNIPWRVESWVDLGTAVRVCSPYW